MGNIGLIRVGMIAFAGLAALWTVGDLRGFESIDSNASAAEISSRLNKVLTDAMEKYYITGVAAGAVRDGEVVWAARMGLASASGDPVKSDTAFNVGSISKPLTAWAVLALAQQGAIELDAPVDRYLSQYKLPQSEYDLEEVTIRRLLRHTAGTNRHGYGGYGAHENQPVDAVDLSTNFEPLAVVREPGTQRAYSGGGYVLLQMIIEDVTGLEFHAAVQDLVLKPLGMRNSGFDPAQLPTRSEAFNYHGDSIEDLRDVASAAAGAYVSANDIARFLMAHADGGGVLNPSSLKAAFSPTEPNPAFAMSYSRWETPLGLLIGHGGNNSSWNTQIYVRPDTQDAFYFLANSTSGAQLDFDLSCAWLSMLNVEEGTARCAEAISLTHKLSWSAYGIALVGLLIFYWLLTSMINNKRSLMLKPRSHGPVRLIGRMLFFVIAMGLLGTAIVIFYTDIAMWRTEVTLIDEMPVNEIGRIITATTATLVLLTLSFWSSPVSSVKSGRNDSLAN